jgi:succinate dehydrogenase / fumarate reductase cytochrome b subunit
MADSRTPAAARPLSPHMTIYRWPMTMAMSIAHRVTGTGLYFGMILFAWWLLAVAAGPNAYATFQSVVGSWIGRLVLFGYTWALIHHMLGGIRHLIWDTIHLLEPGERDWVARATLLGSVTLTILIWLLMYFTTGGLRS